jgi:DNA-binding transcriptional LysR family regulator
MWSIDVFLHLRTFVTVAELESFSHAADELAVGQPLLSRRIKSLETELGAQLFDRSRRQITVTDFGRTLLPRARDLIARAELLEEFVLASRGRERLTLGLPLDCDPRATARIVTAAAEKGHSLDIVELPPLAREAALVDGTLTAALVRRPADSAGITVGLGLGSAHPFEGPTAGSIHLEDLRRVRGDSRPRRRILVTAEDDIPVFTTEFTRLAARSGLARSQIDIGAATSTALVSVLATDDLLVCTQRFSRRHGIAWAPFANTTLSRGYQLSLGSTVQGSEAVRELLGELAALLAAVVDAGSEGRTVPAGQSMSAGHGTSPGQDARLDAVEHMYAPADGWA